MFAIFRKHQTIIGILFCSILSNFASFSATIDFKTESSRDEVHGARYNVGVTFATELAPQEAIQRANFDTRIPFTGNVYRLIWRTQVFTETHATITQIAPKIFLCCRHTAQKLIDDLENFKDINNPIYIQQNDLIIKATNPFAVSNPTADIALMRLEFDYTITASKSSFLPIAQPMNSINTNGYVVSYSDVSVVNEKEIFALRKSLSIHPFQYTNDSSFIKSSLIGSITEDLFDVLKETCETIKRVPNDEKSKAYLKAIAKKAVIRFPETHSKASLRLMSVLHCGCSGAPLIIKQDGVFVILGIHTNGGIFPRFFEKSARIESIKSQDAFYYVNNFVDLIPHSQWITNTVSIMLIDNEAVPDK